jgi:hypothetical protein
MKMDYMQREHQIAAAEKQMAQMQAVGGLGQAPATRQTQMLGAAQRHAESIQRLDDVIDDICRRIEPALRPSTPTPVQSGSGMSKPSEMQAPLAAAWNQVTDHIDNLNERLNDVLSRLEL